MLCATESIRCAQCFQLIPWRSRQLFSMINGKTLEFYGVSCWPTSPFYRDVGHTFKVTFAVIKSICWILLLCAHPFVDVNNGDPYPQERAFNYTCPKNSRINIKTIWLPITIDCISLCKTHSTDAIIRN